MKYNSEIINKKLKKFINLSNSLATTHPAIVVICFHDFFRNLYISDPYIKKRFSKDPYKNILLVLNNCISFLSYGKNLGSYLTNKKNFFKEKKISTSELYGSLWQDRYDNNVLNSSNEFKKFLKRSKINLRNFKDKVILDMGCGSGRFSSELASFKAKKVYGVDSSVYGLQIAKKIAKEKKVNNLEFKHASVLNLPFKNEKFDYVFCKGVLHHTKNLKKGLEEFYRVMKKKGGGYLYLYGSGGIFWNSRKMMRKVMKKIPYKKAFDTLKILEMPAHRTIFLDSWYVEIEKHVSQKYLENWFKKKKLKFVKYKNPLSIELEYAQNYKFFKQIYGDGELRYFITKP